MENLKDKSIRKYSLSETIKCLEARMTDVYMEMRDLENAIEYLKQLEAKSN